MIQILVNATIAVVLNVVLSLVISRFATDEQISPKLGVQSLSFFSQIMHMFVHHKDALFTSSLIIFVLVLCSSYLTTLVPTTRATQMTF